jgi:mevalonate kinase
MKGSQDELEERLKAAEKLLKDMEQSLDKTKKLIETTHQILDAAKLSGDGGKGSS